MKPEQAIYLINNDSLDQDAVERILNGFTLDNTQPSEVDVDGYPVRTFADGRLFYYLLFEGKVPIAFLKTTEVRIVGGRTAYQSQQAGVLSSRFGKALMLKSYQGLLRDRILVSNDTQNVAGHNIFKRLWKTGKYDFYIVNNRWKLVSGAYMEEGSEQFQSTVKGVRVYNSWSCLVACAKLNRLDNKWLRDHLPPDDVARDANREPK